ncbi:hypothetical protein INS49_015680 [Diaporthe citri]|uniref:uncharacterized protein n=1 Tax=Diaporthe citri TaxID=83186 RepID=UPI001C8187C3|nr:uncharacterized protein INS49_015680 [Diaporthe citri]KAG6356293.1 hypothetical protein INS49_015680 [Diaporthe citri]
MIESSREVGDVPIGEDPARLLIEASSSGNDTALQSLLSQPQWIKTILEKPDTISSEMRPLEGPNDVREVMVTPMSNLERALRAAAMNGQAAALSTLTAFAIQQGTHPDLITRWIINKVIMSGSGAAFKALASANPTSNVVNFPVHHGFWPLYEAVRLRKPDVVAALLELGADPFRPVDPSRELATYNSSLLSRAAFSEGPRMTKMLLERGLPVAQTGALHTAAGCGQLDTMRLLMEHGADVDEVLPQFERGEVGAMKLLEDSGARCDLKDVNGRTPAQLLERRNTLLEERNNAEHKIPIGDEISEDLVQYNHFLR